MTIRMIVDQYSLRVPVVLATAAFVISVLSYSRHYGTLHDLINYIVPDLKSDKDNQNRIIPWHSKNTSVVLPNFDISSDISISSDMELSSDISISLTSRDGGCIKALLIDNDVYDMTTDIDNRSRFCRSQDLLPQQNIHTLLFTGGCLSRLNELSNHLKTKEFKQLKVIDLSDNLLRANDPFGKLDMNLLAIKEILMHIHRNSGAFIIVGNSLTSTPSVFDSLITHYPNEFLRLIWISKRDLNDTLIDRLASCLPRVRKSYIHFIIRAHALFYEELNKLSEMYREEFAYLM